MINTQDDGPPDLRGKLEQLRDSLAGDLEGGAIVDPARLAMLADCLSVLAWLDEGKTS